MIPSIEDVLQMLLDGNIDKQQALFYIDQHMENVANGADDLRDYFAAKAINRIAFPTNYENLAKHAYAIADAMLKARKQA